MSSDATSGSRALQASAATAAGLTAPRLPLALLHLAGGDCLGFATDG